MVEPWISSLFVINVLVPAGLHDCPAMASRIHLLGAFMYDYLLLPLVALRVVHRQVAAADVLAVDGALVAADVVSAV